MNKATKEPLVRLADLAKQMGLSKAGARSYAKRHNAKMFTRADYSRRGQQVLCMTKSEADRIREIRKNRGLD